VFAATVSSSVVQPLFGVFSDRRPIPALMPLGVLLGRGRYGARGGGPRLPPDLPLHSP
jgi:FSR family fosmidomycin resistance protein-like MFS transporter